MIFFYLKNYNKLINMEINMELYDEYIYSNWDELKKLKP